MSIAILKNQRFAQKTAIFDHAFLPTLHKFFYQKFPEVGGV
jgi:hypothetical protein